MQNQFDQIINVISLNLPLYKSENELVCYSLCDPLDHLTNYYLVSSSIL